MSSYVYPIGNGEFRTGYRSDKKEDNDEKDNEKEKKSLPLRPNDVEKREPIWKKMGSDNYIHYLLGIKAPEKRDNYVTIECSICGYDPCNCKEINDEKAEHLTTATRNAINSLSTESSMRFNAEKNKNIYRAECNFSVDKAFRELYGSDELSNVRANEMISHMQTSKDWEVVALNEAQDLANKGEFVVAGWQNSVPSKSGHVATIVPGQETMRLWNNEWQSIPNMAEAGYNNRSYSLPLTGGFGKNKHSTTKFYKYNPKK